MLRVLFADRLPPASATEYNSNAENMMGGSVNFMLQVQDVYFPGTISTVRKLLTVRGLPESLPCPRGSRHHLVWDVPTVRSTEMVTDNTANPKKKDRHIRVHGLSWGVKGLSRRARSFSYLRVCCLVDPPCWECALILSFRAANAAST